MTSSSRSTRNSARLLWQCLGFASFAALGGGCSRAPAPQAPRAVYVDAASLAQSHPLWEDVAALDREIAWLSAYRAQPATPPRAIAVDLTVPSRAVAQVDMAALTERIEATLEDVRRREREILERTMENERRADQADIIVAKRNRLTQEAEERFQAVLDRYGLRLANMLVQLTAVTALERAYTPRGTAWEALATEMRERRQALEAQIAEARDRRTEEVLAVFRWLEDRLSQAAIEEEMDALEWIRTHRSKLDALDRRVDEQKALLLEGVRRVAPPSLTLPPEGTGARRAAAAPSTVSLPPLPGPDLAGRIRVLRERRAGLAAFILQNTQATVKAAARAAALPEEPVFEKTTRALPDNTERYRDAVRASAGTGPAGASDALSSARLGAGSPRP